MRQGGGMPRKERIELPGGIYHVISRGNYRKELFTQGRSGEAFEAALFETADRCKWVLHAYVVMSNHYHLALETPEPNLIAGMQWLQSTFAVRFNAFNKERGHVFQGRYKALLVQPGQHFAALVDYIHLNPVRAGICTLGELRVLPLCSYRHYFRDERPGCLHRGRFLSERGLADSPAGMDAYAHWLASRQAATPAEAEALRCRMTRGWAIGEPAYKAELVRKLLARPDATAMAADPTRPELRQAQWQAALTQQLAAAGKTPADIRQDRKGAPWKRQIAVHLRQTTTAPATWIATHLNCGHPSYISKWMPKFSV